MLDRTDFASWKQRTQLYCRGKENGVNILKSIDEGSFQMGTFRETLTEGTEGALNLGLARPRVYSDLSPEDKERYNADIRATNILLQGLSKDIYSLINHYTDVKDIWDNVKMLLEGSELTKEGCESQLYDDFKHFRQNKGETIHDYYVWFAKLINDMRNIKMTMSRMQLNSKFVNNMLPEWGRFVTAVKLNRWLRDSNYDQLVDRIEVMGTMHEVEVPLVMGEHRTELGMLIQVKQGKLSATTATENGVALDEEQLLYIAGGQDNAIDEYVDEQPVQDLALNTMFTANLSSVDPVYDEAGPSYHSDILYEVHNHDHYQDAVCEHHEEHKMHDNVQPNYVVDSHANYTSDSNMIPYEQYVKDIAMSVVQSNVSFVLNDAYMMIFNDMHETHAQPISVTTQNTVVDISLTAKLATYKEQVELYERRARFELTGREQKIDEQLRIVITDRNIKKETLKKELHSVKMQLASTINHNKSMVEENKVAIGYKNPLCLTRAKQVQPALYNGYEIIKNNHVPAIVHNTKDTLEIAEITRRKMNDKMKDPECVINKVKIAPPDYSKENYLATFTPQKQLTLEQIFWSQDLIKMKAEALKKKTTTLRPIKELMVYPQNTPATLVPMMLLTKKVFYVATNSELNVSRFTEMHDAHTIVEARCLELEAELSNLREKIQNDNHNELVKRFPKLEVNHLNLQLKYQNLKESFGNNPSTPTRDTPDFDSAFVIGKMKACLQRKDNITQLTEKVTVLQEKNELFRAENAKIKQHYKELYDSIKITRAKHLEQTNALTTENENQKAQMQTKMKSVSKDHVKPTVLAQARVNYFTNASRSQPRSNTKKNKISPAKGVNKKKVEEHPRTNKSNLRTTNRVDSSSSSKRTVINSNSDSLSNFGNLSKLGKYGNPQAKCLPVLVIGNV
ncbi:hypothetical protein Tco_0093116 [Tanacetum coccineum]